MSEELNKVPGDLAAVERILVALVPARPELDRDGVMYEAGRAAGRRVGRRWLRVWQGSCVVLVAGVVGLAALPRGGIEKKEPGRNQVAVVWTNGEKGAGEGNAEMLAGMMRMRAAMAALAGGGGEVPGSGGGGGWAGGGGGYMPTLRRSEGLDGLPEWRQKAVVIGGSRL